MTLSTKIEVFYGFYICSQWAFIHALLSRVPFASAGLSCLFQFNKRFYLFIFVMFFTFFTFFVIFKRFFTSMLSIVRF